MTGPAIGDLRHRLVLESLQQTSDGAGGFTESWIEVATMSAMIEPVGGGETIDAGRIAGRVTHAITVRYREGVTPAMRFREGPRVFHILAVLNDEERNRWLRCACEERDL